MNLDENGREKHYLVRRFHQKLLDSCAQHQRKINLINLTLFDSWAETKLKLWLGWFSFTFFFLNQAQLLENEILLEIFL